MKKTITLITILIVTYTSAQSIKIKATGSIIDLNKENEKSVNLNKIKYGSNIILEIDQINPFISLTKSFAEYKPINYDFSTVAFSNIDLKEKAKAVEEENRPKDEKTQNYIDIYKNNEKNFLTYSLILENNTKNEIIEKEIIKNRQEIDSLNKEIKKLKDSQIKEIERIMAIEKAKEKFLEDFKTFQNIFNNINNYSSLNTLLENKIKLTPIFIDNIETYKSNAKSTLISLGAKDSDFLKKEIVTELEKIVDVYNKLNANYQKINDILRTKSFDLKGELKDGNAKFEVKSLKAEVNLKYFFEDEMKKVKAIHDSLSLPKYKNKIIAETFKGCELYEQIQTNSYKKSISSPFIYDDKADIEFKIKNDKDEVIFTYPKLTVKTYNQIKINGSAGYFINFVKDELFSTFKETLTGSKTFLREESNSEIKHALGGLIHVYYNVTPNFGVGLSAGLSISEDSNAGFYLGTSFFLTESNRLVFTTGVSFIKVNQLNRDGLNFDSAKNSYFYEDSAYQIKYDKVYRTSFFIGISYNLFK